MPRRRFDPKLLKPLGAACFLMLIVMNPSSSLEAAAQTMHAWAVSVSPSLLPFLIVMPSLTCEETCLLLSRISGGFVRLLRLPQNSTGALLIGFLSGSPAGAAALANVKREPSDPDGAFLRAALIASGASSAFLLSGVAVGMLNAPDMGVLLLRSQFASVLLAALILRSVGSDHASCSALPVRPKQNAVLSAMLTLLNIGGYMVLFSVLARQLSGLISPSMEIPLLAVLELSGGCQALSSLNAPMNLKLPLISAASCFGGISVYAQCMSFLHPLGINPIEYAAGKLLQAALAALITHLQLEYLPLALPWAYSVFERIDPTMFSLLLISCIVLLAMLFAALRWNAEK